MRLDAPLILVSMGYEPELDFHATSDGVAVTIQWLAQTAMPSDAEINAAAATMAQNLRAIERGKLAALVDAAHREVLITRAALMVCLDEFNLHALKINAILDAIDGATSLAALKTAIATIADYPQRTKAQLINAVKSHITSGTEE
jgi:hypothetical protein